MNEWYAARAVKVVPWQRICPPPALLVFTETVMLFLTPFDVSHSVMESHKEYLLKYFHFLRLQRQPRLHQATIMTPLYAGLITVVPSLWIQINRYNNVYNQQTR